MDIFTFILIIVLASLGFGAYEKRLKYLRRTRPDDTCSRDEDIDDLMERVATLESIVTDRKTRLKDEIDNL